MNNKYNVIKTHTEKVTIVITRHQLWKNFIASWADVVWDDYGVGTQCVKEVADVLLTGEPLGKNIYGLRKLFKDGWTVMLMGDAMNELDNDKDILREIIVTDGENTPVTIAHDYIEF